MRSLLDETQLLAQKHVELARIEILAAVEARIRGLAAFIVAGVVGLFALGFLASAAAFGLDEVMAPWLSRIIVTVFFLIVSGGAALYGLKRLQQPSMTPQTTKQTLKEDAEWAKTQLGR
ncbi:MAG: phage holin family protein [Actinomycetota bacterium]|nr:phage holin family protein [Actinomycetota bacterium]